MDTEGRVHGAERLSMVDASIMPDVPSWFTHFPTIMIAERLLERLVAFVLVRPFSTPFWTFAGAQPGHRIPEPGGPGRTRKDTKQTAIKYERTLEEAARILEDLVAHFSKSRGMPIRLMFRRAS